MPQPTKLDPTTLDAPASPAPDPGVSLDNFEEWFAKSPIAREFADKSDAQGWHDLREHLRSLPAPTPAPVQSSAPAPGPESGDGSDPAFEEWYREHGYLKFGTNKETAHRWFDLRKRSTVGSGVALLETMQKAMGAA